MACCYHYSFESCPSPIDWGEGDDEELTVELRSWKLDHTHHPAAVVAFAPREHTVTVSLDDVAFETDDMILKFRDHLTMFGVPQMCHAKMAAGLMKYIEMGFISNEGFYCYPRQIVRMDIVEAWGPAEDLDIENAVRRSMGMESVGQEVEWLRWWEEVEVGVQEPSWIRDDGDFVKAVWEIWMPELLGDRRILEHRGSRVQDELDEVMGESMEVYTTKMVPAREDAIASLEKVLEGEGVEVSCVICSDEEEQRGFSRMPCTHVFHTKFVQAWLRISSSCPLCRYEMS